MKDLTPDVLTPDVCACAQMCARMRVDAWMRE